MKMTLLKQLLQKSGHIVLYGTLMAALVFLLKWLQWKYLITDNSEDIYLGLIAILFTGLGTWVALQFAQGQAKSKTIIIEKEVYIDPPKDFQVNVEALKRLNITKREYEVLEQITQGFSNAEIAENLFLSLSTIKTHAYNLYGKLGVKNRVQAIEKAKRLNIIP